MVLRGQFADNEQKIIKRDEKKVSTKKEQAVGIACSFPCKNVYLQQEEKQTMKLLITHKKVKLIRRYFYFTTLLKKCQYGLRDYIEKVHVNQNVSQRNVVFMRCSYICLAIFHNFFNYKRILV